MTFEITCVTELKPAVFINGTVGPDSAVGSVSDWKSRRHGFKPLHCHITFVKINHNSADLRRAVLSYWQKYVHTALVNQLGAAILSRNSERRLSVDSKQF